MRVSCAILLWCLVVGGGVAGAANDPISQKIERERKTLEKLKGKIEEKRKRAEAAEKKRESVLQGLQSLDERLVHHRQDHHEINKKLRQKDREIDEITDRLGAMRTSIDARREAILARLRVQYMEGRFGRVKALLTADSYSDFQRRGQYLSVVSHKDYELLETFRADMERMEQVERQRAEARVGLVAFKQTIEKKLADIRVLQREKKVYLAKITHEKDSYNRTALPCLHHRRMESEAHSRGRLMEKSCRSSGARNIRPSIPTCSARALKFERQREASSMPS
ncbi:MAG: hypothetical protein HZC50_01930 [Nitrospirae bacterium]|nr:hypothetical protein [Nitrospirota bacterium]